MPWYSPFKKLIPRPGYSSGYADKAIPVSRKLTNYIRSGSLDRKQFDDLMKGIVDNPRTLETYFRGMRKDNPFITDELESVLRKVYHKDPDYALTHTSNVKKVLSDIERPLRDTASRRGETMARLPLIGNKALVANEGDILLNQGPKVLSDLYRAENRATTLRGLIGVGTMGAGVGAGAVGANAYMDNQTTPAGRTYRRAKTYLSDQFN